MHLRAHVAGIYPVHTQRRVLGSEDGGEVFEGGFARPVPAPPWIGLYPGVAGDVDDPGSRLQFASDSLDERERRDGVDVVYLLQRVERIVEQLRLRAGTEDARVVDERVQATGVPRGPGDRPAVFLVGYVAGDGDHTG